ncbi:NAD-dependent epimerase/dehydratase family protein [Rubripirellula reticaptiva]|uniref:NAD dependent epimerase/dehydratase family protein n=1 Tax=Rubripirellula reticaptiva TaxID=2528013 RepID=A0A5C6FA72_9BACT|nr:NAD(P)-dependent oxidoreductase [Rubripirellula reticaptiva]TWU58355.1 NAD dependent epimerase/dehydratase family protein [Rubripirellula reticaptiva]
MTDSPLPSLIDAETQLDALLCRPSDALVEFMRGLDGDLMILGIAGKMGVSLGQLAVSAIGAAGVTKQIIGVARFSNPAAREQLETSGVKTIRCDLLDRESVSALPKVRNVLFMAGRKFGTAGDESLTWAMNTIVPANVADHFRDSNIVAFSTGCVYPLARVGEAPSENAAPAPVGEYAQSCLGRERVFEYASKAWGTAVCLYRLNYAIDLRYGVLHDIADRIWRGEPVDNGSGAFNMIWQGDANQQALQCLGHCSSPARVINVTGPETLSTEEVANELGELLGKPVRFSSTPSERSYLSNSTKATELFGRPSVSAQQLIRWQAHWTKIGGRSLGKPTHFEVNDGTY